MSEYILCELAGATYAIPSVAVRYVEMIEQITPVPNAPSAVEGIVLSRGQVIPALSLRARFGFAPQPHTLRTRLVVVASGERVVGLIVDTAREFARIAPAAISPPPAAISGLSGSYLEGVAALGQRLVLLLRLDEVLKITDSLAPDAGPDEGERDHGILQPTEER